MFCEDPGDTHCLQGGALGGESPLSLDEVPGVLTVHMARALPGAGFHRLFRQVSDISGSENPQQGLFQ